MKKGFSLFVSLVLAMAIGAWIGVQHDVPLMIRLVAGIVTGYGIGTLGARLGCWWEERS